MADETITPPDVAALDLFAWAAQPPSEEWRIIADFPDYEVSSLGRVRRRTDAIQQGARGGVALRARAGQTLKLRLDSDGYALVGLRRNGKARTTKVHHLVCGAFHELRPSPRHEVAHWDGNRANNLFTNLRWTTHAGNVADQIRHGTTTRGVKNPAVRLTEDQVYAIRALCDAGVPQREVARRFGMSPNPVHDISHRRTWAWLPERGQQP